MDKSVFKQKDRYNFASTIYRKLGLKRKPVKAQSNNSNNQKKTLRNEIREGIHAQTIKFFKDDLVAEDLLMDLKSFKTVANILANRFLSKRIDTTSEMVEEAKKIYDTTNITCLLPEDMEYIDRESAKETVSKYLGKKYIPRALKALDLLQEDTSTTATNIQERLKALSQSILWLCYHGIERSSGGNNINILKLILNDIDIDKNSQKKQLKGIIYAGLANALATIFGYVLLIAKKIKIPRSNHKLRRNFKEILQNTKHIIRQSSYLSFQQQDAMQKALGINSRKLYINSPVYDFNANKHNIETLENSDEQCLLPKSELLHETINSVQRQKSTEEGFGCPLNNFSVLNMHFLDKFIDVVLEIIEENFIDNLRIKDIKALRKNKQVDNLVISYAQSKQNPRIRHQL